MTYEQIEKSFVEQISGYTREVLQGQELVNGAFVDSFSTEGVEPIQLAFKRSFIKYLQEQIKSLAGLIKIGSNGEGLPFENSPDIYGNQRVEAYKKGYNQAILDQITHLQAQINSINNNE